MKRRTKIATGVIAATLLLAGCGATTLEGTAGSSTSTDTSTSTTTEQTGSSTTTTVDTTVSGVDVDWSALPTTEQLLFAPMATRSGGRYVPEHRLVVARQVGRPLLPSEVVHHINGVKSDNRPENLEHHDSNSSHRMKHAEVDAEMFRLRRENEALRALLWRFCAASALPDGGTTSR